MMIEADVSLGTLIGESTSASPRPIMAHPPSNTSDILLEKFIVRVAEVGLYNINTALENTNDMHIKSSTSYGTRRRRE